MFPTRMPSMKIVCVRFFSHCLSHTKSHCDMIVSLKILRSYSKSVQLAWQTLSNLSSICVSAHVKFMGGARNMMLIWCQATGNLTRNTTKQIHICHFPRAPMAFVRGSSSTVWFSTSFFSVSNTESNWIRFYLIFMHTLIKLQYYVYLVPLCDYKNRYFN